MKICVAASAGGHLSELLRLSKVWEGRPHFFVTNNDNTLEMFVDGSNAYIVSWGNWKHPFLIGKIIFQCIKIILKEHPDVLVSTGAASGCILGLLTKLTGGKVIWVESLSHVDYLSMSGRIIRPFADMFLVQWPELAEKYPGVTYKGSVI